MKDNNSRAQRLKVIDAKIKVLLVDQSPRWEFRYLQAMLLRDRRVDLKCFLVEGDKAISRTARHAVPAGVSRAPRRIVQIRPRHPRRRGSESPERADTRRT